MRQLHPCLCQNELVEYCKSENIQVVAWSPIMRGRLLDIPVMKELSEKYGKSITQITLRWHIQNDIIPIPKSSNQGRIAENIDLFDFTLSDEDMKKINALNKNEHVSVVPEGTTYDDV